MRIQQPPISRRGLLKVASAAALFAIGGRWRSPSAASARGVIDVHHHMLPPAYLKAFAAEVAKRSAGYTQVLQWTPEKSLADMDNAGVETAVLSMSAPVWFGDKVQAAELARAANEYAIELARAHPGRFAHFATLPLPDVDASIGEARDALSRGALGIVMLSNYEDAYLGDRRFWPLLEEFDRQGAVVYVHPTNASCCLKLLPDVSPAFLELPFDTTRTIASLLYAGCLSRYPRIRFVFSHGGGAIAELADRLSHWSEARPDLAARLPHGPMAELRRIFVDTASVTNAPALAAITALLPPEQILFGTDFPYVPARPQLNELLQRNLEPAALEAIQFGNALRLMPALSKR
jgi:6-methylsalicylate decarboxylase